MSEPGSRPPLGLAAAVDVAVALPGCASSDEGERATSDLMATVFMDRLGTRECDERADAYVTEMIAALWASSRALIAERAAARARITDALSAYSRSREALDRLAGVGSLGLGGWLARLGAMVAGFGIPQILAELTEHEREVTGVLNRSGAFFREIEIELVSEMREPEFLWLLLVSAAGAVLALIVIGPVLRWYRERRMAALAAELAGATARVEAEEVVTAKRVLSRLVRTLVGVMERHYPGAAAREVEEATGVACTARDILDGRADEALAAFADRDLGISGLLA